ncbi:hypothetical protein V7S43_010758 [Phytophthora oleae]
MAKLPDSQVEGITGFSSNSMAYRYVISLKSDQVNIWLEDRSSKKQWQTGLLNKEDYVTAANAFVDASASDYVSCFKQCLDSPFGKDEDVERKLVPQNGRKMKLEMSLKIRLLRSVRTINYTFELKPIAVEPIDILESKLKDQQEELERLRGKISLGTTAFLYVESEAMLDSKLQWKEVAAEAFTLNEDKTSIKVLVSGIYSFGLVVNHTPTANGAPGLISLQMNNETIQSVATGSYYCRSGAYVTHQTNSSLMCVVQVKEGTDLSAICTNTSVIANTPSYFTVARIGG